MLKIGICIATYKRIEGLSCLLRSISRQEIAANTAYDIKVYIVDNDKNGTALEVVKKIESDYPYNIIYAIEERSGIPYVRNRLVSLTAKEDLIIFIDDDEEADIKWLEELLKCYSENKYDVVTGPVIGKIGTNAPEWAKKGNFYNSDRYPDRSEVNVFYTNNTLINRRALDKIIMPFEESMALSGGTDMLLSMKMKVLGRRYIWCDTALVYEEIPQERLKMTWYIKRRYRIGNASVYCEYNLNKKINYINEYLKVIKIFIMSVLVFLSGILYGKHKYVKGIGYLSQAMGAMSALLFNKMYNEYGRKDYRQNG